ncbi:hypothetical protein C8C83_3480 [Flavobacterium sp. 90]|uniref:hypothetical protein n=1 Tax=unclassified Flavobacterium TaxID=196869 RepID=UPI000EB1B7D1|nr:MULTISPECIES: hypothetical protein [unclassified Flavobacterium]RKR11734.1 hypothetical protein C8C82_3798 [Flavobacterium sp. 81]TCK55510.1 hypothetical protein C8C83_3480 [Flavobacterium sp. 90]
MKEKILLYLLLISFSCFSQTGKLNGKLILKDTENYKKVLENTYIILKTSIKTDSIKVDSDLRFVFEDVKAEKKIKIFISPRTYPINTYYIMDLKKNEIKNVEIPYTSTCPYSKDRNNVCPTCSKNDKVLPIVYGLIATVNYKDKDGNPTDKNGNIISKKESKKVKYKSGGCVVSDCQPTWFCQRDKLNF